MTRSISHWRFIQSIRGVRLQLEHVYALTAAVFGIMFIAIIPPGWSPDEPQHYWRVQSLAHGNMIADVYHNADGSVYGGGALSMNTHKFIESYGGTGDPNWKNLRLHFPMANNPGALAHEKESKEQVPVVFSATSKNTPFVYLPYVIGSWIGNTLGLPLLATFLFAKALGLFTLIGAFFYAIRIIPKGKWLVFTLGLLPTTIVQSAAITADTMTLASCILFTAVVIREAFAKTSITRWSYAIIFALIVAIGLVKPTYLAITALLAIIPIMRKEYRSVKPLVGLALLVLICALPGILWVKSALTIPDYYPSNVVPPEQIHHLIAHPLKFTGVLFSTYFSDAQQIIYRGFFGSFIWDTVQLPLVFNFAGVIAFVLALFVTSPREKTKIALPRYAKAVMWAIFALLTVLITYALYVYYSPVGDSSAKGIQGRYFLPFILLPLLALSRPLLPASKQLTFKATICTLLCGMLVASVCVIVGRIYV